MNVLQFRYVYGFHIFAILLIFVTAKPAQTVYEVVSGCIRML